MNPPQSLSWASALSGVQASSLNPCPAHFSVLKFRMSRLCILFLQDKIGVNPEDTKLSPWAPGLNTPAYGGPGRVSHTASKSVLLSLSTIDLWGWKTLFCRRSGAALCPGGCLAASMSNTTRCQQPSQTPTILCLPSPASPPARGDNWRCL